MDVFNSTAEHPLPDGRLELLGAVRTVTGAMTRVETGSATLLVDCGVAQGDEARTWTFPEPARDADAVLLTHGHNDHVGSLPALLEGGWSGAILGTRATLDIADLVLTDGLRLQGASDGELRAFREQFRRLSEPVPYGAWRSVGRETVRVAFREAGHILGSASVEIASDRSRVIVSGDLGRPNSPILRDYETRWSEERPVDLVVLESTYGDREHCQTHDDVERELERIVLRALGDGGHILIPAFAIGRTQTLIYHLNSLIEGNRIPDIPVAIDTPLGLAVTDLYERSRTLFDREALDRIARGDDPLDFDSLYAVKKVRDSIRIDELAGPMIVIAGSGMCTGGRVVGHLRELLPKPQTCVLFVGFQAQGTPGRAIQDAARRGGQVMLDGERVAVRATVETLSGLSAHADQGELLRWVSAIAGVRRVALHHGEERAQRILSEKIRAGARVERR